MTTPRYLTVNAFKLWNRNEITLDDALVEAAINAAEVTIDNLLARKMVVASGSSARYFKPDSPRADVLYINDAATVTTVVENGTTLTENTDFQLEPLNGLSSGGETVPYNRVVRLDNWWYWEGRKRTITITASWGWSAVPYQVVESCKSLTNDILTNRDVRLGIVTVTEAGAASARTNPVVAQMVQHYRGPMAWGLA